MIATTDGVAADNFSVQSDTGHPEKGFIPIATTTGHELGVIPSFDGAEYLVPIVGDQLGNNLTAQRVTLAGIQTGPRVTIAPNAGMAGSVFDGAHHLVVWEDIANASDRNIMGQTLDTDGQLVGAPFVISAAAQNQELVGLDFLAAGSTTSLAVWADARNGVNFDVYGQLMTPPGILLGGPLVIAGDASVREDHCAVAFDGSQYLVVWLQQQSGAAMAYDLFGRFVSETGTLGPPFQISQSVSETGTFVSLQTDGAGFLACWTRKSGSSADVLGRIIGPGSQLPGAEFVVARNVGEQSLPVLASDGGSYLIFWSVPAEKKVKGRFYSLAGAPISAEFLVSDGLGIREVFAVAPHFLGDRYLALGFYTVDGAGDGDVYGRFVDSLAPVIRRQPSVQTAALGKTVVLQVAATGVRPLSYQWRKDGQALAGETAQTLTLSNLMLSDAGSYDVVVSNHAGSTTSAAVAVAVLGPPSISVQPMSQQVSSGASVAFSVTAAGSPPLRYQWTLNGVKLPGETAATLSLASAQASDAGVYEARVSNAAGAVRSARAALLVDAAAGAFTDAYNARPSTAAPGATGFLRGSNVGATSETNEPKHAGKRGGRSVWHTWTGPADGTVTMTTRGSGFDTLLAVYGGNAVSSLTPIASDDDKGGFYSSLVTFRVENGVDYQIAVDGLGGASGDIALSWEFVAGSDDVPEFSSLPDSRSVSAGARVELTPQIQVRNTTQTLPDLRYQWLFNGQTLSGETDIGLTLKDFQRANVGQYRLQITSVNNSFVVTSDPIVVEIGESFTGTTEDKFPDLAANATQSSVQKAQAEPEKASVVTVSAGVLGSQVMSNLESSSELDEPIHGDVAGGSSRWLTLEAASAGTMVVDTIGSDIDTVIAVYTGPDLSNLTLIGSDDNGAPDGIRSRLEFAVVASGEYHVVADGVDGAQGTIQLNWALGAPPAITQSPIDAVVQEHQAAMLGVTATGTAPLSYQWQFNGVDIPGETAADLSLASFGSEDEGSYGVRVENLAGSSLSATAFLALERTVQLFSPQRLGDGSFQFDMTGTTRQDYEVESAGDLKIWSLLLSTNTFTGEATIHDPAAAAESIRFYRIKSADP